ncbi:MAG: hypothetical protein CHACPFDD_01557 [Phycisphaerae bacterium]|nr:hypothetical protein [Phycisphaerae bacterium]
MPKPVTRTPTPDRIRKCARNGLTAVCLAAACGCGGVASAAIATFDGLSEGALDKSFTEGGITFFDLDDRAGGFPVTFTVERADGTLSGPGFSPPNALGFGGWVPGSGAAFAQCGSFKFTTGTIQDFASLDVFEFFSYAGNLISLEAYLGGALVNSTSIVLPGNFQINHWNLSVSGEPFDTLVLIGSGPTDRGVFFGLVDNVVVTPEPATVVGLTLLCGLARRRR